MLTLTSLAVLAGFVSVGATQDCKAFPGTYDWPSDQTWNALNDAVGGRLLTAPEPAAAPCHEGWATSDVDSCASIAEAWITWEFHYSHPTSVMWNQWSNFSCMPDPELPCTNDFYPPFVINATSAEHVKAGIDFARENNVRLIIKNTGHDYIGKSVAPGALSIWTHYITEFTHHDSVTLDGSGKVLEGPAITIGAGTMMHQAAEFVSQHDEVVVGGGGWTVGYAGYALGAGHGPLDIHYGLAADNILEMEVVTPAGEIIRVNEDQNQDLFWAIRGGGGSTFAVVTKFVVQTYPAPVLHNIFWEASVSEDFPELSRFIAFLQLQGSDWLRAGLGGWNMFNNGIPGPAVVPGVREGIYGGTGSLLLAGPEDGQVVDDIFQPTIDIIEERWPGQVNWTHTVTRYDTLIDWFAVSHDMSEAGQSSFLGSRFLTGDAWKDEETLATAIEPILETAGVGYVFLVGGPTLAETAELHGGNSVNPAWRNFDLVLFTGVIIEEPTQASQSEAIASLDAILEPLREITPNGGAPLNEAFPYESEWKTVFWGSNYERLEEIKLAVDPQDVFWCFPCIAHDRWEELPNGQLCKKV